MMIAVVSVILLIWLVLGFKNAGVVGVAIPVTLALTLVVFLMYGYTPNRITLFALIFSIGILVDDAIVVVDQTSFDTDGYRKTEIERCPRWQRKPSTR